MKFISFYLLMIHFLVSSCIHQCLDKSDPPSISEKVAKNIRNIARKKYSLKLYSVSSNNFSTNGEICSIHYGFYARKLINNEIARKLIIKVSLEILKAHHDNPEFKEYLHAHPLSLENLRMDICLSNKNESFSSSKAYPKLRSVKLMDKSVRYCFTEQNDDNDDIDNKKNLNKKNFYDESFSFGVQKVRQDLSLDLLKTARKLSLLD